MAKSSRIKQSDNEISALSDISEPSDEDEYEPRSSPAKKDKDVESLHDVCGLFRPRFTLLVAIDQQAISYSLN
ncbi:hypothetical protein Moror_61 [Moniliophthora roreri MCA 2997]|uniref:Uncharacterized protein n=1 Tax=Moniliophthora roreri (strain MCA 2997) TaxID=1381753 RepID=V2XZM3_MONRO|nr:hypothetical protein Moror_61 [Moniliophthora roreri MCA 2997]